MKNILNRKIRIAIVGCGRISKNHFESIEKHKENIKLIVKNAIDNELMHSFLSKKLA